MVTVDGVDWWWCEEYMWDGEKRAMYVTHHPGPEHEEWQKRKDARKAKFAAYRRGKRDRTAAPSAKDSSASIAANATSTSQDAGADSKDGEPDSKKWKLTMNNQLQSALVTTTNLTPQQFQALWSECQADADDAAKAGN